MFWQLVDHGPTWLSRAIPGNPGQAGISQCRHCPSTFGHTPLWHIFSMPKTVWLFFLQSPKLHNLVNLVILLVSNFELFYISPISQLDNPEAQDKVVVRHPAAGFSPYFCAYLYLLYSRLRKKGHRQVQYFQHSPSLLLNSNNRKS